MAPLHFVICALLLLVMTTSHGFDDESALVQVSHLQDSGKRMPEEVSIHLNSAYVGYLDCGVGEIGVRLTVGKDYKDSRVDVFPMALRDKDGKWCRPYSECEAGYPTTGNIIYDYDAKSYMAEFLPWSMAEEVMQKDCGINAFGFKGPPSPAKFHGALDHEVSFRVYHTNVDHDGARLSKSCKELEQQTDNEHAGRMTCKDIVLERCTGTKPTPSDKVLYLVRLLYPEAAEDNILPYEAVGKALSIRESHYFMDSFTIGHRERIEVVIIPPFARSLELAALAFGNTNTTFQLMLWFVPARESIINYENLRQAVRITLNAGYLLRDKAVSLFQQIEALEEYRTAHDAEFEPDDKKRFAVVKQMFLAQTRKRFIVICDENFFYAMNLKAPDPGEIVPALLKYTTASGELYDPKCWTHF